MHRLTSSLKRIGRSVGRRSRKSIALQSMKDSGIRTMALKILAKDAQKELAALCTIGNASVLWETEPIALRSLCGSHLEQGVVVVIATEAWNFIFVE